MQLRQEGSRLRADCVEHLLLLALAAAVEEGKHAGQEELARPTGHYTLHGGLTGD